ncbi:ABC-F family ATP-binding cassette domain-containing protein [Cellulomonas sp. H30R-01]|uniref:ABC-F family ATP-binding cassette domain-containing protein n=1 Tax=Cellulomonas sp. H30R-01 TaxID=2704467 RepID=UPI00138D012C|nr:ATP-binding cassette domain-containing protein [Cellulomonas sp. H30R-01]QHT55263.1 ABC-F family ATP-binding cassette domain-containing protein [Cellulomonas sp. H30R-01]
MTLPARRDEHAVVDHVHVAADAVTFAYGEQVVLDAVDLVVSAGDRVGLVGENGAGKTTLLRLLAGDLAPLSGAVRRAGTLAVVEQELDEPAGTTVGTLVDRALGAVRVASGELEAAIEGFDHENGDLARLTAAMARYEHLAAWDADRRVDEALTRFGAPRDRERPLDRLSVGERYRVRLACRIGERADVLLLDEPTNHLDAAGVDYLTAQLRDWPGAVVIVTHDRRLLDDVMTAILDLDPSMDGRPALYGATRYADYRFAKDQMLRRWRARYRAERKRALALAERLDTAYEGLSDEWRPPKGSQKHRRGTRARVHVKAADRLIQRLEAEAVEVPVPPPALAFPDLPSVPKPVAGDRGGGGPLLELRAPRVDGGPAGRPRLDLPGRRIEVPPCGRLLVTGPNGSGKSTLLAALAGTVALDRGTRVLAPGARLGVLAQEGPTEHAAPADADGSSPSAFDAYARHALDLLEAGRLDPEQLVPVAALGLLSEADLERPLRELSVGQRRRFDLACALLAAPHLLILDEPTNHLSVGLVDELTDALRLTSAAVVVATHDRRMRADLADWPELTLG